MLHRIFDNKYIVELHKFAIFLKFLVYNRTSQRVRFASVFVGAAIAASIHDGLPFMACVFFPVVIAVLFFFAGRRYEADKVVRETGTWWNYDMPDGERARFTDHIVAIEGVEGNPLLAWIRGEYPRN